MKWTPEQQNARALMRAHLDGPPGVFVLGGYAGTGKTTMCVDALGEQDLLVFTAPTHKAVGVLAGRGLVAGAEYSTIHRLLGCKRQRSEGKTEFVPDFDKSAWSKYAVIVIDEVSMIGETMWNWICTAQKMWPRHVICMGDPAQLPPVNDGDGLSPAFSLMQAELTSVQRSGGAVLAAASHVRQNMQAVLPVDVELVPGEVDRLEREQFLDEALDAFVREQDAKVLAWTNDAVDYVNGLMRRELFGPAVTERPMEGERRVVVSTWSDPDESTMLHAEQDLIIESAVECTWKDLPAWKLRARGIDVALYQLRPEGVGAYKQALAELRFQCRSKKKHWRAFYELDDAFVSLRPGYATTVHKSQGSTYETAFVIDRNLKSCPDPQVRNMLRYVAFSRASKRLVLS